MGQSLGGASVGAPAATSPTSEHVFSVQAQGVLAGQLAPQVRTQVAAGASDDKLFHAALFAASRYFKIRFGSHNENAGTYVTSISAAISAP